MLLHSVKSLSKEQMIAQLLALFHKNISFDISDLFLQLHLRVS